MGFKLRSTEDVFAGLRSLCEPYYREYDHDNYFHHNCDLYEKVVERAEMEYARLLKHCEKQRDELRRVEEKAFDSRRGWIELPKDMDGEHIRLGDKVRFGRDGKPFEVTRLTYLATPQDGHYGYISGDDLLSSYDPSRCSHVEPDSWEKIIKDAMGLGWGGCDDENLISELAGRCERLAGAE